MTQAKAVIYVRLSIARAGSLALDRQERDCRAWAGSQGIEVVAVCRDDGRPAFGRDVAREGLTSALCLLSGGDADVLVVWKLDRLSRRGMDEVGRVLSLVSGVGGRFVAVGDGIDTADPAAEAVISAVARVANAESINLGQRVRAAKADQRDRGLWLGGQAPYGYSARDGRLYLHVEEAAVLRRAASDIGAGASLTSVCRELNRSGTPAPRGGQWGASTLLQLLRGPATAGLMPQTVRGDHGRFSSTVVPWIDPSTGQPVSVLAVGESPVLDVHKQRSLLALLTVRRARRARGAGSGPGPYLLTGLLRCSRCGGRMSASGNSYRCQAVRTGHLCDAPSGAYIPALDAAVAERVRRRLESLSNVPSRLDRSGEGDLEAWRWFLEAETLDRRDVIETLVACVTVSRGRRGARFDPDARLSITWQEGVLGAEGGPGGREDA